MRDFHLLILTALFAALGLFLAWHFNDGHIFERFGALICGTSAVFVILQVVYEIHLDEQRKGIEQRDQIDSQARLSKGMFLPRSLLIRVGQAINKRALEEIHSRRMRFVATVAIATFVGEIIHGFGDLLFILLKNALDNML
jgi:hypothetical protein